MQHSVLLHSGRSLLCFATVGMPSRANSTFSYNGRFRGERLYSVTDLCSWCCSGLAFVVMCFREGLISFTFASDREHFPLPRPRQRVYRRSLSPNTCKGFFLLSSLPQSGLLRFPSLLLLFLILLLILWLGVSSIASISLRYLCGGATGGALGLL